MMSIWSLTRDNGNCGRNAEGSPLCSGIEMEKPFEFSTIFKNYPTMRPSATEIPTPEPTYTTGLITPTPSPIPATGLLGV